MNDFDKIIQQVYAIWELQKEKSEKSLALQEEADKLDMEAEEMEKEMYDLLRKAKELDENAFELFLDGFNPSEGLIS